MLNGLKPSDKIKTNNPLPAEIKKEAESGTIVDLHNGEMGPRYILVREERAPQNPGFFGSVWGKALKVGAGIAVAAAVAAAAFFGLSQQGANLNDIPQGPVAPVEHSVPYTPPTLPDAVEDTTNTNDTNGTATETETAPRTTLPSMRGENGENGSGDRIFPTGVRTVPMDVRTVPGTN